MIKFATPDDPEAVEYSANAANAIDAVNEDVLELPRPEAVTTPKKNAIQRLWSLLQSSAQAMIDHRPIHRHPLTVDYSYVDACELEHR